MRSWQKKVRVYVLLVFLAWATPAIAEVVYTTFANVFTANQRINAGLGVNVAPGATGTISLSGGLFERSRSVAMGEWTSVAYNAANFTANIGSWTVDSADQVTYAYTLVGKTMTIALSIESTDVSAAANELRVAIPGGFVSQREVRLVGAQVVDAGGAATIGLVLVSASGTIVRVFKDVTGSAYTITAADNTTFRTSLTFEVQ